MWPFNSRARDAQTEYPNTEHAKSEIHFEVFTLLHNATVALEVESLEHIGRFRTFSYASASARTPARGRSLDA